MICRWDRFLPSRSQEASGRAAEEAAKQVTANRGNTAFVEEPLMPLVLRIGAAGAEDSSQSTSTVSRTQWEGQVVQELMTLEVEGQRRQHAVIGKSCLWPCGVLLATLSCQLKAPPATCACAKPSWHCTSWQCCASVIKTRCLLLPTVRVTSSYMNG